MHDGGKVIIGLIVFVALFTSPLWYGKVAGKSGGEPVLEKPANAEKCIESLDYMRANHMDMLNTWRDEVVREGKRIYTATDGKTYVKSLTDTCLGCHSDSTKFCDQCHNYAGVNPYCWDCHVKTRGE